MVEEALTAFCIGQEGTHVTRLMPQAVLLSLKPAWLEVAQS